VLHQHAGAEDVAEANAVAAQGAGVGGGAVALLHVVMAVLGALEEAGW
jgi:hypothetical protein